jgi:hypothetical protein
VAGALVGPLVVVACGFDDLARARVGNPDDLDARERPRCRRLNLRVRLVRCVRLASTMAQ